MPDVEQQQGEHSTTGGGYRVATRTHIGLRRKRNEDFLGVDTTPGGLLMVVCDGMGGHAAGDRASRMAVETFIRTLQDERGDAAVAMRKGIRVANRAIYEESVAIGAAEGMGTTLVAALVKGSLARIINIGDSRAYHMHDGDIIRITSDHSYVGELVARGEITDEEAFVHPQRNVITRALGSGNGDDPDLFEVTLADGDLLLLSTDGLHGLVPDGDIEAILNENPSVESACDMLIVAALAAGGTDNVTVALLKAGAGGDDAGPGTSPGTLPSSPSVSEPGTSWITIWSIIMLAVLGLSWWGYSRFVAPATIQLPDSTMAAIHDSISRLDSARSPASPFQSDTFVVGGDSLSQAGGSRRADSPAKDLSGTFAPIRGGDSGTKSVRRLKQKR